MVEISTSILSIKKEESTKKFYDLELAHTDYFHIDVMDGEFVENDTSKIMQEYAELIKQISNIPLDVHLMVKDIKKYVEEYIVLEPNIITFHYEALQDANEISKIVKYIKQNNIKVGIAIKPNTKLEEIYSILPYVHMVLIMTVEPGKGGQKLILDTIEKIKELKQYTIENNIDIDIEADGGINIENIEKLKEVGMDIAVVGTGITKTPDYKKTIQGLKK